MIDWEPLIVAARDVRARAYAPYSQFRVGAALLAQGGRVHVGCNVENASYGATLCAERNAAASLIAAGDRVVLAVAVYVEGVPPAAPCGLCRQVLWEVGPGAEVLMVSDQGRRNSTLAALLPDAFELVSTGDVRPGTSRP